MNRFDSDGRGVIDAILAKRRWDLRLPNFSIWDWYAFLLPLAAWGSINVGGTLFGSDFMLLLSLPLVVTRSIKMLFYKPVRNVLILGALWLVSQIATDIIRETPMADFARGWLKIIFTLSEFFVVWVLVHNSKKRCILFALGLAFGSALRSVTFKSDFFLTDPWKFGFALPVSILILLGVSQLMRKGYSAYHLLPIILLAVVNVYEGSRSMAFILMITAVITHGYKTLIASSKRLSKAKLAGLAIAVLIAAGAVNQMYSFAASHMWLGEKSYQKYKEQAQGVGGILLGGRAEILGSSAAIADSPWIGHGSWAKDPKYIWIMIKRMRDLGYPGRRIDQDEELIAQDNSIPAHSHLMGAWVEAGLLGAVFWAYILFLMIRFLLTLSGDEPFLPFALFQVTLLIWDILFSPYGAERRFTFTYFLALILAITYQRERQQSRFSVARINAWPVNGL